MTPGHFDEPPRFLLPFHLILLIRPSLCKENPKGDPFFTHIPSEKIKKPLFPFSALKTHYPKV